MSTQRTSHQTLVVKLETDVDQEKSPPRMAERTGKFPDPHATAKVIVKVEEATRSDGLSKIPMGADCKLTTGNSDLPEVKFEPGTHGEMRSESAEDMEEETSGELNSPPVAGCNIKMESFSESESDTKLQAGSCGDNPTTASFSSSTAIILGSVMSERVCGKTFGPSRLLKNHMTTQTEGPFHCPEPGCGKVYIVLTQLKNHVRKHKIRTGERPFHCTEPGCGKAFTQSYHLKNHVRTHTGEKPYLCPTCGKSFNTSGELKGHTRTHTGERPFHCSEPGCDKAFSLSGDLRAHIRTHTGERPFRCSEPGCEKTFIQRPHLKVHLKTHTGEKPFHCLEPFCDKSFNTSNKLKIHAQVHSGLRSFHCKETACGKSFVTLSNLRQHEKTHRIRTISLYRSSV